MEFATQKAIWDAYQAHLAGNSVAWRSFVRETGQAAEAHWLFMLLLAVSLGLCFLAGLVWAIRAKCAKDWHVGVAIGCSIGLATTLLACPIEMGLANRDANRPEQATLERLSGGRP